MNKHRLKDIASTSGVQFGTSGARGLVRQMTASVCHAYTQAFLRAVAVDAPSVVLGHDLRPSSPDIAAACAQAVRDADKSVMYVGALPTPAVAYHAMTLGAPSIVVTGSHIPFDRNGIKFYSARGEISKADEAAMLESTVEVPAALTVQALAGVDRSALDAYVQRYIHFFGASALQGMRVGVYEHSSVARDVLRTLLQALGAEVRSLGRAEGFVPIDTEAVRAEDVKQARAWATEHAFDAILSTDGDADRPLMGDEADNWLRGDIVGILCAQYLEAEVVVTPVSSNTATEACGSFAQVVRTRIGSPYVIAGMETAKANAAGTAAATCAVVAGFEANGGFLLGSDVTRDGRLLRALPTRDAVLPMLALLCMAHEKGCPVSALTAGLPQRFTASDRLQNFPTETSRALTARLSQDLSQAADLLAPDAGAVVQTDTTDGLRLTFASGDIVHLRPSGNAPELRCYAEGCSMARANELCTRALQQVAAICST